MNSRFFVVARRTVIVALLALLVVLLFRPQWVAQWRAGLRLAWQGGASPVRVPAAGTPSDGAAGAPFDPARLALGLEPVVRGLAAPVDLRDAGEGTGRLYVVEKRGTIRVVSGGAVAPVPFLDIQPLVRSEESERGLLGLAFHPRFAQNGFFYVNYTDRPSGHTMVVRYTVRPGSAAADPNSAQTILRVEQPAANHNGGNLVFGPDGYLYIGMGDGGGGGDTFGNGQNSQALLGKLLRIDVDRSEGGRPYAIPPDNPFAGNPSYRPEIWAYGLRNPWRYSFDRATGDLYIGDVGQNVYEEIDYVPAGSRGGLNFGWPRMEGLHCFPGGNGCDRRGLQLPVAEYDHSAGCSVTGGFVYRGRTYPLLAGAYLFGDFCSGRIWTLHRTGGNWLRTQVLQTNVQISSFGEDQNGEVYVTGLADGTLYRIVAAAR